MGTVNHKVKSSADLEIALIEGTPIKVWCGIEFVPHIRIGSSGRADEPSAPTCEQCDEVISDWRAWIRLKDEKNRLIREMRAIEKAQEQRQRQWREDRERIPEVAL